MKNKKTIRVAIFVALISIGFCLCIAPTSFAYTTVYFDVNDSLSDLVGSIQFDILEPASTDVSSFTASFPNGWFNFSSGNTVSAFDGIGTAPLQNGVVGTFDIDVILGNFELGDQSGNVISEHLYNIIANGSDYTISNVPLPSALLLLGGGLVGMIGIRRKTMK